MKTKTTNENFKSKERMKIAIAAAIDKEKSRLNSEVIIITQEILASYFGVTKQRINQIIMKHDLHSFIIEYANDKTIELLKSIDTGSFTSFKLKKHLNFPFTEQHLRKLLQLNNLPYKRTDLQSLKEGLISEEDYVILKRKKRIKKYAKLKTSENFSGVKKIKYKINNKPQSEKSLLKRKIIINNI